MDELIGTFGASLSEGERAAVQEHLATCEACRAELNRMWLIVRHLSVPPTEPVTGQPHLSDLDLAVFAHARFGAQDAGRIMEHLVACPECRLVLMAARQAMDDYEEQVAVSALDLEELRNELAVGMSTPRRYLRLFGALFAFVVQCLLAAVALGQLILAYAVSYPDYWTVPDFWPLRLVPAGPARLWVLVLACAAGAVLMRTLAARLYGAATGLSSARREPR